MDWKDWEKRIDQITNMSPQRRHKLRIIMWHRSLAKESRIVWPREARKAWNDHIRQTAKEFNEKRFGKSE